MEKINLDEENFDTEVLQSSVPVLVDFWAAWCGPCQMMGPILEELATEYGEDKIKIRKVNVDDSQVLAGKYQVMSIPTFLLFSGGEVKDQIVGGISKDKLKEFIDGNLS